VNGNLNSANNGALAV